MFKEILIIAGGIVSPLLKQKAVLEENPYIIALNGGYRNSVKLNVKPHLIMGDLDSLTGSEADSITGKDISKEISIEIFPPEKDKSDLELALHRAVSMNPQKITLWGALGKRIDHTLFNIFLLANFKHIPIIIENEKEKLFLCASSVEINDPPGTLVSLINLSEKTEGIFTEGLKYPLINETLHLGSSRGLSNVITKTPAKITHKTGRLLAVITYAQS